MDIPQRLIQTARSRNLDPFSRAAASNLRLLHPDWEYLFFDDSDVQDFLRSHYREFVTIFESFRFKIQKFDFFRYLAVHKYGGFYFDLDVLLWRSLDELRKHQAVFPFEELTINSYLRDRLNADWEIGNYAFGARPENPFLGKIIENCVRAQKDPEWHRPMLRGIPRIFRSDFEVLTSTGPGLVSRTFFEELALASEVAILFPDDVRDQESWHQFGNFGMHFMQGSWRTKGSFLRRKLALIWESRVLRRNLQRSESLGPHRSLPPNTTSKSLNTTHATA